MSRLIVAALCATFLLTSDAFAGERVRLGYGRLISNDMIGDGHDRWRTGSVASSRVWGPQWSGQLPDRFGQLIELRFGAQTIAPETLGVPAAGDRRFAGALSLGLHTHYRIGPSDIAIGGDLVFTGPQTGLDDLQGLLHDTIGGDDLSSFTRATQIGNDFNPTLVVEMGRNIGLGGSARLRPFYEARAGVETLMRVGADLSFGTVGQGELLVRDPVTGHRYRTVVEDKPGMSFLMGGDMAYVSSSEFLPSNQGYRLSDSRNRLRAGVHWHSAQGHQAFYGLTWLDREFKGQRESQIVGSLRLKLEF